MNRLLLIVASLIISFGVSAQASVTDFAKRAGVNKQSLRTPSVKPRSLLRPRMASYAAMAEVKSHKCARKPLSTQKSTLGQSGTRLNACVLNATSWGSAPQYGMYSFTPDAYGFNSEKLHYEFNAVGGACYIGDNKYWMVTYTDFGGWLWVEQFLYDTTSWTQISNTYGSETDIFTAMVYDPITAKAYGCFSNAAMTGYEFGCFDTSTHSRTKICDLYDPWIACGVSADGTLYAIDDFSSLYKVNISTGALTYVGETGVYSDNLTSGAIDPATGIFYVATANDRDPSGLYAVDLSTAKAQLLYDFEDGEELAGMYVVQSGGGAQSPAPDVATDLNATVTPGSLDVRFSFKTPAADVGGGELPESVRYEILVDNNTASTGFTAPGQTVNTIVRVGAFGLHSFSVVMYSGDAASETASIVVDVTDDVALATLPFSQLFDTQSDFDLMKVTDANADGAKWMYWQNTAFCPFNADNASDDYLITPGMELRPGHVYRFSFDIWQRGAAYAEAFEVKIGSGSTLEDFDQTLLPRTNLADGKTHRVILDITPDHDGTFYLAIHAVSDRNKYGIYVDNIRMESGVNLSAPDFPTLTATPDYGGGISTELSVTVPSTDVDGRPLGELTELYVSCDGETFHTASDVTPGQTLTLTHKPATDGYHTYTAAVSNSAGAGRIAERRVYVGINYPAKVKSTSIRETENTGEVTITWEGPDTDVDGLALNPSLVTYLIGYRPKGSNMEVLGRGVKGNSFTFRAVEADARQQFLQYLVLPETSKGVNDWDLTYTDIVAVGAPYALPYKETFGSDSPKYYTSSSHNLSVWKTVTDTYDQDGDGKYLFYEAYRNHTGSVTTGKINLAATAPAFSFWYQAFDDSTGEIDVEVNDGNGFRHVSTVRLCDGSTQDWANHVVSLAEFAGRTVQIRLTYLTEDYRLAIDNMEVYQLSGLDIELQSVVVPVRIKPGVAAEMKVNLANVGATDPGEFTVQLIRDDALVAVTTVPGLAPMAKTTVTVADTLSSLDPAEVTYIIKTVVKGDTDTSNNDSDIFTLRVFPTDYPAPTDLTANANGADVKLQWTAPAIPTGPVATADGAEDYPAFSNQMPHSEVTGDSMGEWISLDRDGLYSYAFQLGGVQCNYPNVYYPMGFMVFNFDQSGIASKYKANFGPHSGSQCFAGTAAIGGQNDDWLISPRLSGAAQTVKFYAKSAINIYGLESFEFLYSTTGTLPEDFIRLDLQESSVPADWTEYSYDLPEGALYFAVRYVSDDVYMLLLDDFSFEAVHPHAALTFDGYRVYCDRKPLDPTPVSATEFTHSTAAEAGHTYHVTAAYTEGESEPSNSATVTLGAITDASADAGINVHATAGLLTVDNPSGIGVTVTDTAGHTLARSSHSLRLRVAMGTYIVRATTGAVWKVLVR